MRGANPWLAALRARWFGMSGRDRLIVGVIGWIVLAALVYTFGWLPAVQGISQAENGLARARSDHAAMIALAEEARRLKGASMQDTVLAPGERVEALKRSLARAGLSQAESGAPTLDEAGQLEVRFADIDYAAFIVWLGRAETELGAAVARASVSELTPDKGAGHVRADIVLRWQQPGAHT